MEIVGSEIQISNNINNRRVLLNRNTQREGFEITKHVDKGGYYVNVNFAKKTTKS